MVDGEENAHLFLRSEQERAENTSLWQTLVIVMKEEEEEEEVLQPSVFMSSLHHS